MKKIEKIADKYCLVPELISLKFESRNWNFFPTKVSRLVFFSFAAEVTGGAKQDFEERGICRYD